MTASNAMIASSHLRRASSMREASRAAEKYVAVARTVIPAKDLGWPRITKVRGPIRRDTMHSADGVWNAVVGYAVREGSVETLARGSENDLAYDAGADELVLENEAAYRLDRAQVGRAWSVARDDGHLRRENARDAMGAFRASVLLALLARALDLRYDTDPVRVFPPASVR